MTTGEGEHLLASFRQAAALARQLPSGHLFVVPNCGHEVPARRPGLFNEAVSGFYRATEVEARKRAERVERNENEGGSR